MRSTDVAPTPTGGDVLVDALHEGGVRVVYGLPGVHNLGAWAALAKSPIRLVCVRHEQTAVYAADGHARISGDLGVAMTTTGPGAANALAATGEAYASGSPVLVIATDIASTLRRPGVRRGALHETRDQAAMFAPVVKATLTASSAEELAELVRHGMELACAAPTAPVYLQIPMDFLSAPVSASLAPAGIGKLNGPPVPSRRAIERAVALVTKSERPLIWAGGGAARADAGAAIEALATRLGAPIVETLMARGLIDVEHPAYLGLPPHLPETGKLWDDADLVVAVGSDLDGVMTQNWAQPAPPALLAINIDAADASKNYHPDVVLEGDARTVCEQLNAAIDEGDLPTRQPPSLGEIRAAVLDRIEAEEPRALEFLRTLRAAIPEHTRVVADMCIPGYWVAAFHPFRGPRALAYAIGWGTLGFGFPASIGAALSTDDPVLAICGDGGFLFGCGELATIAQERVPVTVLVVDDSAYGMLRYDQEHAGQEVFGVELNSPDFVALANAFGVEAERVDGVGEALGDALARHLRNGRPSMVITEVSLMPPPTTSPRWYRRQGS